MTDQIRLSIGDHDIFVDLPEKFRDLEAGMLHVEHALRILFEKHGLIQSYDDRMKELGHRPEPLNPVKFHLQNTGVSK